MADNKTHLHYSESFSQPYFIASVDKSNDSLKANYFINPDESIPLGYVLYDYYGDGELYLNPTYIYGGYEVFAKPNNMTDISHQIRSISYDQVKSLGTSTFEISKIALNIADIHYAYTHHPILAKGDGIYVVIEFDYIFDINAENIVESNIISSHSPAVCSYFTHDGDALQIISKDYKFANTIKNAYLCSHPNRSSAYSPCSFSSCFTDCSVYTPAKTQVAKVSVNHKNTNNSTIVSINKLLLSNNNISYDLYNESNNQSILQVSVPENTPQEDVDNKISDLLSEITSIYQDEEVVEVPLSENKEENESFIATIFDWV